VVGLRNTGLDPEGELLSDAGSWLERASGLLNSLPPSRLVLVGQSLGGVLALSLAARLREQGREVARLVLVDSFVPTAMVLRPDESLARAMGLSLPESIVGSMDFSNDAWLDTLFAFATKAGMVPSDLSLAQVRRIYRVARANEAMVQSLSLPVIESLPVLHVRAALNPLDSSVGWKQGAYPFRFISLEGDHESVLREDHATALAGLIAAFAKQE
jgi:thioesterase domain-containing protein